MPNTYLRYLNFQNFNIYEEQLQNLEKSLKFCGHKLLLMTSFEKFCGDKLLRVTYFNKFHGHSHNRENLCPQVSFFKEYGQYVNILNKTTEGKSLHYYAPTPTSSIRFHFKLYFLQVGFVPLP